jgi:hypothetical protein
MNILDRAACYLVLAFWMVIFAGFGDLFIG